MRGKDEDPFDLRRFVEAQDKCYAQVLAELRNGRKRTHWMWFIFPQLIGLGRSPTASYYAIRDVAEAEAFLAHELLGKRLQECTRAVLDHGKLTPTAIFGYPDDMKFCSSMTLFDHVATNTSLFASAIKKYCHGKQDERTLALLHASDIS